MRRKKSLSEPRVPLPVEGIQVNFCKNVECPKFGVPASHEMQKKGRGATTTDGYIVSTHHGDVPTIRCASCGRSSTLKSNQGVIEERDRMLKHLFVNIDLISCPDKDCANHGLDLSAGKSHYHKFGETDIGSKRYRCKACGKTFFCTHQADGKAKATAQKQDDFEDAGEQGAHPAYLRDGGSVGRHGLP